MKIKKLIEYLKKFDPEDDACYNDHLKGIRSITTISVVDDVIIFGDEEKKKGKKDECR